MSLAPTHPHSPTTTGGFPQLLHRLREQASAVQAQLRQTASDWWGDSPATRTALRRALGNSVAIADGDLPTAAATVDETLIVYQPAHVLYRFWRDVENLPALFRLLDDVDAHDFWRSEWALRSPARGTVSCEVEIYDERDDQWLAWRSTGGELSLSGRVLFDALMPPRTTMHVMLHFAPPDDDPEATPATLLGEDFAKQLAADVRSFKRAMETGGLLPATA